MRKIFHWLATLAFGVSAMSPLSAQEAGETGNKRPPEWIAACVAAGRAAPADCTLEQRLLLADSGELAAAVKIRVPDSPRQPAMVLHLPQGLFLPAGVNLRVDEGKAVNLQLQTCDGRGCYAGMVVTDELLGAMKAGSSLHLGVQNVQKQRFDIVLSLLGFTAGYEKIE